ncbi:MAG: HDOD domain-containing protein [Armatimonadetes bacterium]|nr:HDOD domain-containing protein [Armatimonadota bacterium]
MSLGAKILARIRKHPKSEEVSIAGLMHDIGRLVADVFLTEEMIQAIEESQRTSRPLYLVEESTLGASHAEIGRMAAEKWQLPDMIRNAIAYHHPSRDQEAYAITLFIHEVDHLAYQYGFPPIHGEVPMPMDERLLEALQIPLAQFDPIGQVILKEAEEVGAAFGL